MQQSLTDLHLDAIIRAGFVPPPEGSRKTICPQCSRDREKSSERCVSLYPDETEIRWRCRHCGQRGKALLRA